MVWEYKAGYNVLEFNEEQINAHFATMELEDIKRFMVLAYAEGGKLISIQDDAHFMNHSAEPNLGLPEGIKDENTYALRDI